MFKQPQTLRNRRPPAAGLFLATALLLAACSPATATHTPTPTTTAALTPYHSPTPTPSATPVPSITPTPRGAPIPTPSPTFTPTPFFYTIQKDDTFGGLALRFGSSIEAIKTANPEVNPNLLVIGQQVIIPLPTPVSPSAEVTASPTATPLPVALAAPVCYRAVEGAVWCFLLAQNTGEQTLESPRGVIVLWRNGEEIARAAALPPLELLAEGQTLPLIASFSPPIPEGFEASGELTGVFPLSDGQARYAPATARVREESIAAGGLSARLKGEILLPEGAPAVGGIRAVVVAYGENGVVVGVRQWQGGGEFEVTVYSLGPKITRLEIFVEALWAAEGQ